ncbi:putative integral membrane protein [Penicillium digitatum]|nr:putative integral membrane protein [Penicillium digitatum]
MTDEHQRKTAVQTIAAVFLPIATITVMLRIYVRGWIVKAFGWDDGAMVIALLFYAMFCGTMIGGTLYGTGYKFEHLPVENRRIAMKYWWLCEIAYCFASVGCKISICIFLMRITVKRIHIWILYVIMVLTVIAGLIFMFLMLLQCRPLEYFWTRVAEDPAITGKCMDVKIIVMMTYIYSSFAALCDFTVGSLPVFLVHKLHMKRQTKIAVVGILSMACIASAAVIVRFPFVKTFYDPDFLYATYQIAVWSNIEAGLGITAGSLATLRPLLRAWTGSNSDPYYSSRLPGGRSRSASRPLGGGENGPFPLSSLDSSVQSRLRPDKLAVTVTTIQSQRQRDTDDAYSTSPSSSEERLTIDRPSPRLPDVGLGIHRTFEVTQISSERDDSERKVVREHV